MNAKQIFSQVFEQESIPFIEYNTQWENGTGYLDNAVKNKDHAPRLEPGDRVKSQTTQGRKIIMVGTHLGNVVLFERYTDPESSVVVANMPRAVSCIVNDCGSLSPETVANILGVVAGKESIYSFGSDNIGDKISNIINAYNNVTNPNEVGCEIVN